MKNRGLLGAGRLDPTTFKKDPSPETLPNQRMATEDLPPNAVEPEHIVGAAAPTQDLVKAEPKAAAPQKPRKGAQQPRAIKSEGPSASERFVLRFALDAGLVESFERTLSALDPKTQSLVKRDIAKGFLAELERTPSERAAYAPQKTASYRLDLRLTEAQRDAILEVERNSPLEPVGIVIARNLAPRFADYLKRKTKA